MKIQQAPEQAIGYADATMDLPARIAKDSEVGIEKAAHGAAPQNTL